MRADPAAVDPRHEARARCPVRAAPLAGREPPRARVPRAGAHGARGGQGDPRVRPERHAAAPLGRGLRARDRVARRRAAPAPAQQDRRQAARRRGDARGDRGRLGPRGARHGLAADRAGRPDRTVSPEHAAAGDRLPAQHARRRRALRRGPPGVRRDGAQPRGRRRAARCSHGISDAGAAQRRVRLSGRARPGAEGRRHHAASRRDRGARGDQRRGQDDAREDPRRAVSAGLRADAARRARRHRAAATCGPPPPCCFRTSSATASPRRTTSRSAGRSATPTRARRRRRTAGRDRRGAGPPRARLRHRPEQGVHRWRGPVARPVATPGAGPRVLPRRAVRDPRRADRLARRAGRGRPVRPDPRALRGPHRPVHLAPVRQRPHRRPDLRPRRRPDRRARDPGVADGARRHLRPAVSAAGRGLPDPAGAGRARRGEAACDERDAAQLPAQAAG